MKTYRKFWIRAGGIAATLASAALLAAPGELDCSFGNGGIVNRDLTSLEGAYDAELQSDGRIVTLGSGDGVLRLSRFLASGELDTSFVNGGSIVYTYSGLGFTGNLAIDSQNRIVVAGSILSPDSDAFVARFLPDGSVDTGFGGGDGWTSFDIATITNGAGNEGVTAVAIDSADRPVIGGYADANGNVFNPSNSEMAIARLTTAGVLDASFDGDGLAGASSPGSANDDDSRGLAIDGTGRIVAIGSTAYPNTFNSGPRNTIVARWTSNGTLDSSFDGDGVRIIDMSQTNADDFGIDIAIDGNGRAVILGQGSDDPLLGRLLDNGNLDTSFAGDGVVQQSFIGGQDVVEHVLVQADGKILVTGWPVINGWFHFTSMRFSTIGVLDATWGTNGVVTSSISTNERAYAAILQPDQKLILAGGLNNDQNLVMARYLNGAQVQVGTTTTITAHAPDPSRLGQSVMVSYSVARASGGATPPGDVTVSDGVDSCTASAAAGGCNLVFSTAGTRNLQAHYAGTTCFAGSDSPPAAHLVQYTLTPTAGTGGSIAPSTAQGIAPGASMDFVLTPNGGFRIGTVTGCGGSLNGNTYTTGPASADCTITASFNRNPVASNGTPTTLEDHSTTGTLAAIDDNPLSFSLASAAGKGVVTITNTSSGAYSYVPLANANGSDSFSFKVNDGGVDSNVAMVSITITPVNDAPALSLANVGAHPAGSSGVRTQPGFASVDFGPPDEDLSQAVADMLIDSIIDPAGVLVFNSVDIGNDGTLSYGLTGVGGSATISARVRDNAGTANGGVDTSAAQSFSISVARGADLQIGKSNGQNDLEDGEITIYAIVVANAGPNPVSGASLSDLLPATLVEGSWACLQAQSNTPCPAPIAGSGNLATLIDLPVNAYLRFDVMATVNAAGSNEVINTASVAPPAGVTALDLSNDSATDQDPIISDRIFGHGFEGSGSGLTVPGAQEALQAQ